jgi:hypothetical protein
MSAMAREPQLAGEGYARQRSRRGERHLNLRRFRTTSARSSPVTRCNHLTNFDNFRRATSWSSTTASG